MRCSAISRLYGLLSTTSADIFSIFARAGACICMRQWAAGGRARAARQAAGGGAGADGRPVWPGAEQSSSTGDRWLALLQGAWLQPRIGAGGRAVGSGAGRSRTGWVVGGWQQPAAGRGREARRQPGGGGRRRAPALRRAPPWARPGRRRRRRRRRARRRPAPASPSACAPSGATPGPSAAGVEGRAGAAPLLLLCPLEAAVSPEQPSRWWTQAAAGGGPQRSRARARAFCTVSCRLEDSSDSTVCCVHDRRRVSSGWAMRWPDRRAACWGAAPGASSGRWPAPWPW
jgi:hypothetical protein